MDQVLSNGTKLYQFGGQEIVNVGDITPSSMASTGAVSGTTGTFTGNVSGVDGTFTGDVSGVGGTFTGAVSGTTVTGTGLGSFAGVTTTSTITNTLAGSAAGAVLKLDGSATDGGIQYYKIDEEVTLTNAVETDLTSTLPAGAVVQYAFMNNTSLVVGDGTGDDGLTKVGLGTNGDPDKYLLSADLVKNTKTKNTFTPVMLAAEETVTVKAADNAGAAVTEKFVAGGTVRVVIYYAKLNDLVSAA